MARTPESTKAYQGRPRVDTTRHSVQRTLWEAV
ncbi:Uncharacterised protein [Mycobacteroides abscessus subsp. bolletii]|nr:Uncharacterised protein [Mycobacteroides abscessus subsp. bolletii]SLD52033.1 Uncharacterised protein [Mycobacteroides abscessus subsp. bolletii]SLE28144.1 Uncharacterised protein [Mycobacteroides abscessus subsp. bolletii]